MAFYLANSLIAHCNDLRIHIGLFVLFVCILLWRFIIYPKYYSPLCHLPGPAAPSLLNGHFWTILNEPPGMPMRMWINEILNDGLIHYYTLFNQSELLLTSHTALKEVMVSKSDHFIKPPRISKALEKIVGRGILLAEGDEHKCQRRLLQPVFASRHINRLYPIFWSKSHQMIESLLSSRTGKNSERPESEFEIEISDWISRASLDMIGEAGMGFHFDCIQKPDTEPLASYRKAFRPSNRSRLLTALHKFLPISLIHAYSLNRMSKMIRAKAVEIVDNHVSVDATDRSLPDVKIERKASVDLLFRILRIPDFSKEAIVEQMMTFLTAGHETTASAATWGVYLLCQNPGVQSKLRKELRSKVSPVAASTSMESLGPQSYLHAVCSEVLRLYPPIPLTIWEAVRDTSILGQPVPKGTKVLIVPWATNVAKQVWGQDANDFRPGRWLGNNRCTSTAPGFMTFLSGRRSCIAERFARAELACLLASLTMKFEMTLSHRESTVEIERIITIRPKGGLFIKMKKL